MTISSSSSHISHRLASIDMWASWEKSQMPGLWQNEQNVLLSLIDPTPSQLTEIAELAHEQHLSVMEAMDNMARITQNRKVV